MIGLKNVTPENLWYIIGYIAADGHLSKDGRHINITSKDRPHLYSIRKALNLKIKVGRKARSTEKQKKYSQIQFSNVKFYKYLRSIGFVENKSLKLGVIRVEPKYFSDFLRGVIDGDGCISTWVNRANQHRQWALRITSAAPKFIKWLKTETEQRLQVKGRLYGYKYKLNPIYTLKFGKLAAKIILKNIYYDNCLCLERKRTISDKCLQDKSKMLKYGVVLGSPGAGIW